MFKQLLILDFETRWASGPCAWAPEGYSLSKITTEEYIRSPLFKAFGMGYHVYGEEGYYYLTFPFIQGFFNSIDWSQTAVCTHNAQFDAAILSWVYGVKPAFIIDTLSMARALRGIEVGNSLSVLAQEYGLPSKGRTIHSTNGLWELSSEVQNELAEYCKHDVFLGKEIFERMAPAFPKRELQLIDATIRMFTQPQLKVDTALLDVVLKEEQEQRTSLLNKLNVTDSDLASADRFAEALQALGVNPPKKISKTTGKVAWAFAKTDAGFQQLANGDNEDVAMLCEARLAVKSTQERTRAQRFLDIASRNDGYLPVPVNYAHTRTLRWGASRGAQINMQNLKREGTLRKAIVAPLNHVVCAGDLSQIEPRVLAYLAGDEALLAIFKAGGDPYGMFGTQMFGVPDISKNSHPDLRQSAKSALLGAGYGLGWANFAAQLLTGFLGAPPVRYDKKFAKQLGIGPDAVVKFVSGAAGEERHKRMLEIAHTCTEQELLIHCVCAKEIIDRYRAAATPVVAYWSFLDKMLRTVISVPGAEPVTYKCLVFEPGKIKLPNGLYIYYNEIETEHDEQGRVQYTYLNDKKRKKLYSGILAENTVSGVARCVIGDAMNRIQKRHQCAMPVHDEAVYVMAEEVAEEESAWIKEQMIAPVPYLPGIPLDATVGYAVRYGEAK